MTMITPSYLGETIEYSSLHACRSTLEDPTVIEPYLVQEGFVHRTPRGRMLTETAYRHLDLPVPVSVPGQFDLLAPLAAVEDELP